MLTQQLLKVQKKRRKLCMYTCSNPSHYRIEILRTCGLDEESQDTRLAHPSPVVMVMKAMAFHSRLTLDVKVKFNQVERDGETGSGVSGRAKTL